MKKMICIGLLFCLNAFAGQIILDGAVTVPKLNAQTSDPSGILNCSAALSASSNILTFSLKDKTGATPTALSPCTVPFRNSTSTTGTYTTRKVTSSLSQTLTAGTSLGIKASTDQYMWFYLIDSDGAGTMKLGVSQVLLDEGSTQATVAESFSATATSAAPAVFTATSHGMSNGDIVCLTGTPPTGFNACGTTNYWVVNKATSTFQLSLTQGGTGVTSSSTGTSIVIHNAGPKFVSDAVYTGAPVRLIARGQFSNSTPGNWTNPLEISVGKKQSSVWTGGETNFRIEAVTVDKTCSSSPCTIVYQSGNWVSKVTRSSTGTYDIIVNVGVFTQGPTCVGLAPDVGRSLQTNVGNTATDVNISITNGSGTASDDGFEVICFGN